MVYTVQAGTTAFLECLVEGLNNRSVSWVRKRDRHILAVDWEVFISDPRLSILHSDGRWTLIIRDVRARDEGTYQCQVSAKNRLSKLIDLVVVVPSVVIMPVGDRHVRMGSTVVMECVVDQVIHRPHHVAWFGNGKVRMRKQDLSFRY